MLYHTKDYTIQICIVSIENMPKTNSRQQLLDTAAELFYRDGYRAVGVDTLSAKSCVGKMTLYRHFATKEELIVAYLERSNAQFWEWFEEATAAAKKPEDKIIAFFHAVEIRVQDPDCHGCPFLNAVVEFPDLRHPGHQMALANRDAVRARFRELAAQAELPDPDRLADHLLLLMDGAFIAARLYGPQNPGAQVSAAVQRLLEK